MKKANALLQEIKDGMEHPNMNLGCFQVDEHPARDLDEYMKEQYFTSLFSVMIQTENTENEAMSYLLHIACQAGFDIEPERLVKNIFAFDDKMLQDCSVSFRDEEIKYLLGFELYTVAHMLHDEKISSEYLNKFLNLIEISEEEHAAYVLIFQTLKENNLANYTRKEYYPHTHILKCYLSHFDFVKERLLVVSNCIKEVRSSGCKKSIDFIASVFFIEAQFLSEYNPGDFRYVEKNSPLGHFIAMVGGFALGTAGYITNSDNKTVRKWDRMDEDEERLTTPKFKDYSNFRSMIDRDYYDDNTYEVCDIIAEKSGVFHLIYNVIGEYNDPFAVIAHPLDNEEEIRKYLDEQIDLSRSRNKKEE